MAKRQGIMLCYPYEEKRLRKWKPPFYIQPKLDGVRCRAELKTTGVELHSSTNQIITSVPHINKALDDMKHELWHHGIFELDGELYIHGWNFNQINSLVSRTVNRREDYEQMEYHVFDHISDVLDMDTRIYVRL